MTDPPLPGPGEVSPASFRDPAGFVFHHQGQILRQVNLSYARHFAMLTGSGLYDSLIERQMLVSHALSDASPPRPDIAHSVLYPEQIPFISYPYEWSFGQLKAAALQTLAVQRLALDHGMGLKDASAFNIQFLRGRPVLIDTLSFEAYEDGRPWMAYRQFCEHFLAPLVLMSQLDPWLGRLPLLTVDGVPLEIASRLLPWRSRFSPSVQLHIHQHARLTRRYGGRAVPSRVADKGLSKSSLINLVEGLEHFVQSLEWEPTGTEWADYESEHGYGGPDQAEKVRLVTETLGRIAPERVWDLGANTGVYSRIARETGAWVLAADIDPGAVERNYRRIVNDGEEGIHPLVMDLRNPSPAVGWGLAERESISGRADADVVLALALVHHLAIGGNVPLDRVAAWFGELAPELVIEFVPKEDPQVSRLLVSREDIFDDYSAAGFEAAFAQHFTEIESAEIGRSGRVLYRFTRQDS